MVVGKDTVNAKSVHVHEYKCHPKTTEPEET